MLAASYWSLLAPAIEMANDSGMYGSLIFLPVAVGFTAGAVFVYSADLLLPLMVSQVCDFHSLYNAIWDALKLMC